MRHLETVQLAAVTLEMLPFYEAEAAERQKASRAVPGEKVGSKATERIQQPSGKNEKTAAAAAAKVTGSNAHYVADAKKLKADHPDLYEDYRCVCKSLKHSINTIYTELVLISRLNRRKLRS